MVFNQVNMVIKYSNRTFSDNKTIVAVLEIAAGHWPFSDQFQHLADQNSFWSAKFTVHFLWDSNQ